jgi:hypothetical protein
MGGELDAIPLDGLLLRIKGFFGGGASPLG